MWAFLVIGTWVKVAIGSCWVKSVSVGPGQVRAEHNSPLSFMTKTYTALTANTGTWLLPACLLTCEDVAAAQPQMIRLRGWGSL